ncbi:UNVERIFIED_CONTAM: hypothetical protein FKN15_058565 [Acipenser sinensis]
MWCPIPEQLTGPIASQPVAPPQPAPVVALPVQPQREWDIDAVSRDASDVLEGESIEAEVASQHSEQDIELEVLDTDDPTWSVVERATRHLGIKWPMAELPRRSLFESPSAQPHQSRILPAFPDFIKEVQSTWGAPASAPATSRKASAFSMQGASEAGLASFPPVDAAFAALVKTPTLSGLTKDPACPNKQCRTTEVHLKKGYAAATEAVRLSNVASLLTVYQAALIRDLPECPSAALRSELGMVSQLLVKLAQLNAQAQGRSIASLVVARRQLKPQFQLKPPPFRGVLISLGFLYVALIYAVDEAYERKKLRYAQLATEAEQRGWRVRVYPVEVGCRGFVAHSTTRFLRDVGFSGQELRRTVKNLSEAAEKSSNWLWLRRKDSGWGSQAQ